MGPRAWSDGLSIYNGLSVAGQRASGLVGRSALRPIPELARLSDASAPRTRPLRKFIGNQRPIMQRRRVEVCSVRPHERTSLRIEHDLIENGWIPERPEWRAMENRQKVDSLLGAVDERHHERERAHDVE